jgi:uncharacterized membrane protein
LTLESSKTLGGIGAILLLISFFLSLLHPVVCLIVGILGVILILVGLRGLADYYHEHSIFNNALYGFIALIIGTITAVAIFVGTILLNLNNIKSFIGQLYPGWNGDWASLQYMPTPDTSSIQAGNFDFSVLMSILVGFLVMAVVIIVFLIISTVFVWRSLKTVTEKSTIGLFGTAGLLMLIGAVLTIVVIGVFLIWVGVLLLAIAFFQLHPVEPVMASAPPSPPVTV